jgi:RNA polymerase sigma-70 factor (ECF subfamily)
LNKIRSDKVRFSPQIDDLLQEIADNSPCHEEMVNASLLLDFIFDETKSTTKDMAILHYVDGLTLEETAKMMNMSVSGVRKRLSVLRNHAKQCVGE